MTTRDERYARWLGPLRSGGLVEPLGAARLRTLARARGRYYGVVAGGLVITVGTPLLVALRLGPSGAVEAVGLCGRALLGAMVALLVRLWFARWARTLRAARLDTAVEVFRGRVRLPSDDDVSRWLVRSGLARVGEAVTVTLHADTGEALLVGARPVVEPCRAPVAMVAARGPSLALTPEERIEVHALAERRLEAAWLDGAAPASLAFGVTFMLAFPALARVGGAPGPAAITVVVGCALVVALVSWSAFTCRARARALTLRGDADRPLARAGDALVLDASNVPWLEAGVPSRERLAGGGLAGFGVPRLGRRTLGAPTRF